MTEQEIWKQLYNEQIQNVTNHAVESYVAGLMRMDLRTLPRLDTLYIPNWNLFPILGKSPEPEFWDRLSKGVFNVNIRLRSEEQLRYLEERDLFHDVFGHTPLLWNNKFSVYIKTLGMLAQAARKPGIEKALSNVYWATAEFGLMSQGTDFKVYGGGILSSIDEICHVYSGKVIIKPFDIEEVIAMDGYVTDGFQEQYFMLQDWGQLGDILKYLWNRYV